MDAEQPFALFIKRSDTFSLITWVATYRAFKTFRQKVLEAMTELDFRRQNGSNVPYEDLIEKESILLKSLSSGKGYFIQFNNDQELFKIKEICHGILITKNKLYIGEINEEIKNKLSDFFLERFTIEYANSIVSSKLS